jgi:ATP-dependent exoDNAse (exonuclease V) beta subunit
MTMHKAKGLEFDTVILPGLAKPIRSQDSQVLAWQEVPLGAHGSRPVLAPMAATGAAPDALYRYLTRLERSKQANESDRLLYVACTRARRRLHLFAQIAVTRDAPGGGLSVRTPHAGSLLQRLWPAVASAAHAEAPTLPPVQERDGSRTWVQPPLRRLPADWRAPAPAPALHLPELDPLSEGGAPPVYEWVSSWAVQAGSVVHRWLKLIAEEGIERFDRRRIERRRPDFRRMLRQLGTGSDDLERATSRVVDALAATLEDERGRWILSRDHAEAHSELPLTVWTGHRCRQLVIDRTFVDADGCRWIVDYKTGTHLGGDVTTFLRTEAERHREQLLLYRDALARLTPGAIRSALYFPLLTTFLEIELDGAPESS